MPHTHYTTLISADNLAERLSNAPGSVLVFDCSFDLVDPDAGERAYAAGHIPGAHYLHLDRDLSGVKTGKNGRHPLPERDVLVATLAKHGLKQHQQVVAYDAQGGTFAARLWWLLRWLGHDSVALLDGGLQAWQAAGQTLETATPAAPAKGDFKAAAPLAVTVDAQHVLANINGGEQVVVDARSPDRYRGENETIDPVEFAAVIGQKQPEQVILQCGSGATACHNALAMEIAGLHGAAVYIGSWSEWCADPSRPVATGPNP